jgi:Uma2 family endonuclease
MTPEEFFRWILDQEARHELVDGVPVMMAGADRRHDRIAVNMIRLLGDRLQGGRCQSFTSDTAIRIPAGNIRYPDLGVDCGAFDDSSLAANEPLLVVEILSPSTQAFDRTEKLEEYKTVPALSYILLVDPTAPQLRLYSRDGEAGWQTRGMAGLDAEIEFPRLAVTLPLREVYAGLDFSESCWTHTEIHKSDYANRFLKEDRN